MQVIRTYTCMVREAIKWIIKGMNTHREKRHPRTGSGTNTSLKERGNTILSVSLHKSFIFFGYNSTGASKVQLHWPNFKNEKYFVVLLCFHTPSFKKIMARYLS